MSTLLFPTFPPIKDFHQQDWPDYCGAACLQMVLHMLGFPLSKLSQLSLFTDTVARSSLEIPGIMWSSAPDGMIKTLIHRLPPITGSNYHLFEEATATDVTTQIIRTITIYKKPSIALVFHRQHWVVVLGYRPFSIFLDGGFWINNPWPPLPTPVLNDESQPLPPHTDDDVCGSGPARTFGQPHEFVTGIAWIKIYMTGVDIGHWTGKFLAISIKTKTVFPEFEYLYKRNQFPEGPIISPEDAKENAVKAIEQYEFNKEEFLLGVLDGAVPEKTMLVQHLDFEDEFYYIVQMISPNKEIAALVSVDGKDGKFNQAGFAQKDKPIYCDFIERNAIPEILGKKIPLPGKDEYLYVHPETVSVYPTLVWKPCAESLTPYLPFFQVLIKDKLVYVRVDGKLFTELTIDKGGL